MTDDARSRARRPFLTAEWRHLVMLSYEVDLDVLAPLVPAGLALDLWHGRALVSVVGFRFLDARVLGAAIPRHRDFDEVNLRFYVRRDMPGGETRHGVVFVSRLAVALLARLAYNEPYRAVRMRSATPRGASAGVGAGRGGLVGDRVRAAAARDDGPTEDEPEMKIVYTPISTLVPSLTPEQDAEILAAAGTDSVLVVAKTPDRQREEIVDADVLFGRVSSEIFVAARRLRYYHCLGAGVDSVLSPELVESDVILASEKGEVGIHLAEHAFALLLALTRGLHTALREPDFRLREPIRREQRELWEQTMGIVGFGGTGRAVARRALGFGLKVLAVDVENVPPEPGVTLWKADRLHDLLAASDVVVIALPLTKATRHLFTRDLFRRMQRHAILINVTRGEI